MRKLRETEIEERKVRILGAMAEVKCYTKAARMLGMSKTGLMRQINAFGLRDEIRGMLSSWNDTLHSDIQRLASGSMTDKEMAARLNITVSMVRNRRRKMELSKVRGRKMRSSMSMKNSMIIHLSEKFTQSEIAQVMGCSRQYINQVVKKEGV